jgi:hypothetical protein
VPIAQRFLWGVRFDPAPGFGRFPLWEIITMRAIELLKKKGQTRTHIALACDTTRRCVGFWESGRSLPRVKHLRHLINLAKKHGITLLASDLLTKKSKA